MPKNTPKRAASKEKAEQTRQHENREGTGKQNQHKSIEEFESTVDLPGRTDSGPEPDVFGQEIPPQS
jgi:hypothetical protein